MTQEDKQLLRQDLCARLPYRVIVQYKGHNTIIKNKLLTGSDLDCNMEYYKPYLRPMSSMTEEEKVEYCDLQYKFLLSSQYPVTAGYALYDWLNKNMFDYRGLIPKGQAIEVTKDNNFYKEIVL